MQQCTPHMQHNRHLFILEFELSYITAFAPQAKLSNPGCARSRKRYMQATDRKLVNYNLLVPTGNSLCILISAIVHLYGARLLHNACAGHALNPATQLCPRRRPQNSCGPRLWPYALQTALQIRECACMESLCRAGAAHARSQSRCI